MNNFDTLYQSGSVKRWHTVRTIQPQTVAEHCWGVLLILHKICKPSQNLIKVTMLHDAAEHATGDIPAPIKWAYPHLDDALDTVEQDFFETHGIDQYLTESETKLLKWADMMELVMFAKSEVHMGNLHMFPIFRRGKAYLEALPFPTEQARQLFEKEATNVQNHS